jgi:ribosomal protein L29
MKVRDVKELHTKSREELQKMLAEARSAKHEAAMELAQLKAKNTRQMFNKRREIAQILTVMNLKEKSDAQAMADKGGQK